MVLLASNEAAASKMGTAMSSCLGRSGSEASQMLSGDADVGGVDVKEATFEEVESVGAREKLGSGANAANRSPSTSVVMTRARGRDDGFERGWGVLFAAKDALKSRKRGYTCSLSRDAAGAGCGRLRMECNETCLDA